MRKLSFIFASLLLVVTMYAQDLKAIRNSVYRIYRICYGQQTGLTARTENERLPQR